MRRCTTLITLSIFISLFLNSLKCSEIGEIKTFIPNFNLKSFEVSNDLMEEPKSTYLTSTTSGKVSQRRFRSFSEVDDFEDRRRWDKRQKFEGVKYGSFYEFLLKKIIFDDLKFVEHLGNVIALPQLNLTPLKCWMMLDKLMRDPTIVHFDALTEFTFLVISLEHGKGDLAIYKAALETLRFAMKTHKPILIIRALMKYLRPQLTEKDTISIFTIISGILDNQMMVGSLPEGFSMMTVALEELNPLPWFNQILFDSEDGNVHPDFVTLAPFHFLFLKIDNQVEVDPVKEILEKCLFEGNRENLGIISKFIKLSNFCTCPDRRGTSFKKRRDAFKFVLERFEIAPKDYEDNFDAAVEASHFGLVEGFLLYTDHLMKVYESLPYYIMDALYSSKFEMAVLIITYRPFSADEFTATWKNTPVDIRKQLDTFSIGAINNLLRLAEEFDSDFADFKESVDPDGTVIHPFPQPRTYEDIYKKSIGIVKSSALNSFWIARIILTKYFGIAFSSTRILYDSDSTPIWLDIAGAVNVFLNIMQMKHQVRYIEPRVDNQ